MNFFLKAAPTNFPLPYWLDNAAFAETVATGRLHCLPQSHQADGTLVFALEGRVELHVVALRFLGEGGGRGAGAGAAAQAGALLLGRGAAGAGHGSTAAALRLSASAAAVAVQQTHGSCRGATRTALKQAKNIGQLTIFRHFPLSQAKIKFISDQKHWNGVTDLVLLKITGFVLFPLSCFAYLVIRRKGHCILSAQFKHTPPFL